MTRAIRPTSLPEIAALRERYRAEAGCQIVRYSILPRGLADPWAIDMRGILVGYAGVWNSHFPGRLMEFYLVPELRNDAAATFREVLEITGAAEAEAQSNMPLMSAMLQTHATSIRAENLLFSDGRPTNLHLPGTTVRRRVDADGGPDGEWVVHLDGRVVAAGGVLTHYNPPYGDLYFEVEADMRGRGIGSYLVQELRRRGREQGLVPAARCRPDNEISRRTMLLGGMQECGLLLAGNVTLSA